MGADKIFLNVLKDRELSLKAFEFYLEHQNIKAQKTKLHNGIRELLDTLKQEQVPMSIVTGRHSRDLEVLLSPLDMRNYFVTMIADDHVSYSKPKPDGILLAAERMKMDVKDTLYIGDSVGDMHAAQNAGSLAVAALWDELALEVELSATKPSFMARTPTDLLNYFRSLK